MVIRNKLTIDGSGKVSAGCYQEFSPYERTLLGVWGEVGERLLPSIRRVTTIASHLTKAVGSMGRLSEETERGSRTSLSERVRID
jgi:hypothetical protein